MKKLPGRPFTWFLVILIAFFYLTSEKENNDKSSKTDIELPTIEKTKISISDYFKAPIDSAVKELSSTQRGRAVVAAITNDELKNKYGGNDILLINSSETNSVKRLDILKGQGNEAVCGDLVKISYEALTKENLTFDKSNSDLSLKIGEGKVIRGLEEGLLGMQKGGKRKIAIPASLAFDMKGYNNDAIPSGSPVLYIVDLVDIVKSTAHSDNMSFVPEIISDGTGTSVLCGDKVSLEFDISLNGKQSKKDIKTYIGEHKIPISIENIVNGMKKGEVRSIKLLGRAMSNIKGSFLFKDLKIGDNDTLIVNIKLTDF